MKKFFAYSSLIILGGCLSSSDGDIGVRGDINTSMRPTGGSGSSSSSSNRNSSLATLTKIDSVSSSVEKENTNRILKAFALNGLKYTEKSKEYTIAKNALLNNSKSPIATRITNLNKFLTLYTDDYKSNVENKAKYSEFYLSQGPLASYEVDSVMTEEAKAYAKFLSENVKSGTDYSESIAYINAVHSYLLNEINKLGLGTTYASYNEAYTALGNAISTLTTSISSTESSMLNALKVLDPAITELPFKLDTVVEYYKSEVDVLKVVKDVSLLQNPSRDYNTALSGNSFSDGGDEVRYVYNSTLKDYTIKNDTSSVEFKASDFSLDGKAYVASSKKQSFLTNDFYTFMPNLKSYIYAGGAFDDEIKSRIQNVRAILEKKKAGTVLSSEEQTIFDKWFSGTNFSYGEVDGKTDVSSLLNDLFAKNSVDLTIDKKVSSVETVRLGGQALGLSFVDFGIWEREILTSYSGDENILSKNPSGNLVNSLTYPSTAFYLGMTDLKTGYAKKDTDLGKTITFQGNTLAVATKVGKDSTTPWVKEDLSGVAKLVISNDTLKGDLTLDFDKYYTFAYKGFDVSSPDFSYGSVEVSTPNKVLSSVQFASGASFTTMMNGSMYGLEAGNPTEAAGYYNINSANVGGVNSEKYSKININGSFGVKR